jgi:mRNA-degrading endonuclease RelE of RelBE toxin-antitoxin system
MTLLEEIEKRVSSLPPEKQSEVLDFIAFLQQRINASQPVKRYSLKKHPAFGSWKGRKIDALQYQQNLRAEWDN